MTATNGRSRRENKIDVRDNFIPCTCFLPSIDSFCPPIPAGKTSSLSRSRRSHYGRPSTADTAPLPCHRTRRSLSRSSAPRQGRRRCPCFGIIHVGMEFSFGDADSRFSERRTDGRSAKREARLSHPSRTCCLYVSRRYPHYNQITVRDFLSQGRNYVSS